MEPKDARNVGIEAPVPDLLDHRGRLRRLAVAAAIGVLVAVVVAALTYAIAGSDAEGGPGVAARTSAAAWRFIIFFTGLSWVLTFLVANHLLARRSRRRDSLIATATLRTRA